MRPLLIGVGGSHSGAGKTYACCRILESLNGFGAVKCTPTLIYSSLVDDPAILNQKDKDTSLMLQSGAVEAMWVQAPKKEMAETARMAVDRLNRREGVIIEGNSAIEVLRPDIVIFIFSGGPDAPGNVKESANKTLAMAHIVIYDGERPPDGMPEAAAAFRRDDTAGYIGRVKELINGRSR